MCNYMIWRLHLPLGRQVDRREVEEVVVGAVHVSRSSILCVRVMPSQPLINLPLTRLKLHPDLHQRRHLRSDDHDLLIMPPL